MRLDAAQVRLDQNFRDWCGFVGGNPKPLQHGSAENFQLCFADAHCGLFLAGTERFGGEFGIAMDAARNSRVLVPAVSPGSITGWGDSLSGTWECIDGLVASATGALCPSANAWAP